MHRGGGAGTASGTKRSSVPLPPSLPPTVALFYSALTFSGPRVRAQQKLREKYKKQT